MANKVQILKVVARFITYLDKLPEEQLHHLESGEAEIRHEFVNKSKSFKTSRKVVEKPTGFLAENVVSYLHSIENRQEAEDYLNRNCPNRVDLETLARKLDIPFVKKDNLEHLRNKIIEGTVGYKLRSQAIQTSGITHQ
jgi:hypothetical protein